MTSITKHQYDFPKSNCANKENVSSNGKSNEVTTKSSSGIDSNFDWAKREAISQQRKLRLIEVRQQSKEIASKVRENVRQEEKRQLEKINRIKRDELLKWRQKQVGTLETDYKNCLEQIGEAHRAAEQENEKQHLIDEQRERNRRMALKRGKIATEKLKENAMLKQTKPVQKVKEKQVVTISKKVDSSPESVSDTSTSSSSSSSTSDSSVCSVILVEKKKKPETKTKDEPVKLTISPPKRSSLAKSPAKKPQYNPLRFASVNNSTETDISLTDSPLSDPPPLITKVSDLLGRKSSGKPTVPLRSSPHIAKTYKLDKSPVTSRVTTTKKPTQKSQINTVSSRLSRVIKTPTKSSGKSPLKVLPERKHFVPEFVKFKASTSATKSDSAVQTVPQHSSKVQFYDHANRFSRQYDGNIDLHEQVQNIIPLNAWEEAKRNAEVDEIKRNELLSMRQLAENRSKVALEKEKIRKDYELMSSQLSEILKNNDLAKSFVETNELLSESRLRQIAEEKQQLMNNDFRNLLKTSTVITCPKVDEKNDRKSAKQRPEPSDLNVAQTKSDGAKSKSKQARDTDVSTDSTHSFLLDYVNERTNNICEDIDRCRNENAGKATNQTKIDALHDLLNKVNSFRRILCEEIKQNNGDISRIDASQLIDEIEKVEEKQNEIMKDKTDDKKSNKKQPSQKRERDLKERERLLKIKENCIDERARELYMREKQIEEDKKLPKKSILKPTTETKTKPVAVVSANGSEILDDIPVRIVINVNKNEMGKEKSTDVIVNDIKWGDKLKKAIEVKENVQIVPVTNGNGKVYPKTPAKSKVVQIENKKLDISSQSTSTTSYLSPPDQIRTHLTNALQRSAIQKNVQPPDDNPQVTDSQLLQYIIRMLGMSRTSIEQLNQSSVSTVRTPNSSIINVSSNRQYITSSNSTSILDASSISTEHLQSVDKAKLQQLARYLAENNKLATANARKNSKESATSSGMWDEILSKKNEPSSSKSERIDSEKEMQKQGKRSSVQRQKEVVEDPDDKLSRHDLIAKYDELAASCTNRIINLDAMISKVREEKQKLLENTISSASSLLTGQKENQTEYMDYPQPEANQQANTNVGSPLSDSKGTNAPSSDFSSTSGTADTSMPAENRPGLIDNKNKPLGESKDSGVGISRPVTSSDYRESPDLRQNAKGTDNGSKLLQDALRESKRDAGFEPLLKDIPRVNYQISTENNDQPVCGAEPTPDPILTNSRDKNTKAPPPAALTRYSPQMEDELPHELSTITEVDTPATSRLNATDANDNTLKNSSMSQAPDNNVLKLLYNAFPNFKDYVKSNPNLSHTSMASLNESDATTGASAVLDEKIARLLQTYSSQADELNYKKFDGEDQRPQNDKILEDSALRMSYCKFPSHSDYAKSVPGLLDSQSLDQMQLSDANDHSLSSLPDIVHELKNRKILEHSFEEAEGKETDDLDDLLLIQGNQKTVSAQTTEDRNQDESLSEELEHDLNSMGLSWVTAEMKKSKAISTSTSVSSDTSNHTDRSRRSSAKQLSPLKPKTAKRKYAKIDQTKATNDSFVDKHLVMPSNSNEHGTVTTQPTDEDPQVRSVNLKEFLARELLKHSSMSSSSDSSLASMFLKSFLGHSSNGRLPETPQNRGIDKHRTSTPVDHSSDSRGEASSKRVIHSSSAIEGINMNTNNTASPTFFDNESQLSSVHMSTTDSTPTL